MATRRHVVEAGAWGVGSLKARLFSSGRYGPGAAAPLPLQCSARSIARTGAAVGQAQHKVGDGVLALALLARGRAHVPLVQLDDLVLRGWGLLMAEEGGKGQRGMCGGGKA